MSELAFPLLGVAAVFLILVPLATLIAKSLLVLAVSLSRRKAEIDHRGGGYALLVAPVLAPLALSISAGVHQTETGAALAACLAAHIGGEACSDAVLFVAALALPLVGRSLWGVSPFRAGRPVGVAPLAQIARIRSLCAANARLAKLRVRVVTGADEPICTRGLWRPVVIIDAALADRLPDGPLRAALLHEAAHALGRDPLRYRLAAICLSLNPAGRLVRADLQKWRLHRESACDDFALASGSSPLDLADALVAAARPQSTPHAAACLRAHSMGALQLRVQRLLLFAEKGVSPVPPRHHTPSLVGLLALSIVLPQWLGSAPLKHFHTGIERLLAAAGLF